MFPFVSRASWRRRHIRFSCTTGRTTAQPLLAFLTALILATTTSLARLYPTQPSATTILTAGSPALVSWIDDTHRPFLSEMGPVQIDLYTSDSSTYIGRLAQDVPASLQSANVVIPSNVPFVITNCTLLFTTTLPPLSIYSADFLVTTLANVPVTIGQQQPQQQQALAPVTVPIPFPDPVSAVIVPPPAIAVTTSTVFGAPPPSPNAVQVIALTQQEQQTVTVTQEQPQLVIPTFIPNFPVVQTTFAVIPPAPPQVPPALPPAIITVPPAVPPAPLLPSQPTIIEFMDGSVPVTQNLGLPPAPIAPPIPVQPVAQPDPAAVQALESLLQGYPVFLSRVAATPAPTPAASQVPVVMTISLETPLVLPSTTIDVLTISNNVTANTDTSSSDGGGDDASTLSAFRVTVTYDPFASASLGPLDGSGTRGLGFTHWWLFLVVCLFMYRS